MIENEGIDHRDVVAVSKNGLIKVTIEYIGEGLCGDYDPEDVTDMPLLRFSVSRLYRKGETPKPYFSNQEGPCLEKEWVAINDASYCTNLPARMMTPKMRKAAARIVLAEVSGPAIEEYSIKKIGERLSWLGLEDIRKFTKCSKTSN
jgi:hypothetical protein